jgi:cell filamentation protein
VSDFADPYCYPDSNCLKNKLGIRNAAELDRAERLLVSERQHDRIPFGEFDLKHLQAIHRHLFQDL